MIGKQFIIQEVLGAIVLMMFVWHYRQWRFKQRVRAQMAERGETPAKAKRWTAGQWAMVVIGFAGAGLMLWAQPKLAAAYGTWGKMAGWGGLFVVIFVGVFLWIVVTRDRRPCGRRRWH